MYCLELKPYIKWHEIFVISLGHWPYLSPLITLVMRLVLGFFLITLSVPLAICIYKARQNFDRLLECLPMTVTVLIITWAYFIFFIIKRKKLLDLLNHVSDDFETLQSFEAEFEILKESAKEGRFAAVAYIVYTIFSTIIYCSITLMPQILNVIVPLNESRPRSYVSEVDYVFFDRNEHYLFTYFHTAIVGSYCVMIIVGFDVMLYFFIQHACGMFRVLRYRLKHITEVIVTDNSKNYEENMNFEIFQRAVTCVKMHQRILDFTDSINSCFSICLLICIEVTIILLSFQGAMVYFFILSFLFLTTIVIQYFNRKNKRIIFKLDETQFVIRYGTYAFAQIVHLLYNSITGQKLVNHSSDVTNCIYESQWYRTPRKIQTIVIIMMMRSLRESRVKIGNMFILCLETYCSIMKTIFSYLSVLTTTKE